MMYHFFNIGTYSPRSTKVLLGYVVMYVKIYIWAKWDLGTLGGKHSFLQIYTDFVPNWLNIIKWHSQLLFSSYGHKYQRSCFLKNISYMVAFSTLLVLKKYYAIYRRPQSTFSVFLSVLYFFLMLNPHRIQLSAMRNLALFKEPAL